MERPDDADDLAGAVPEQVTRGAMRVLAQAGLDRPNLGLERRVVGLLVLLCSFALLVSFRPPVPGPLQYLQRWGEPGAIEETGQGARSEAISSLAINVASDDVYVASDGTVFVPDIYAVGGIQLQWGPLANVSGTPDAPLYAKERYGASFDYQFPNLVNGLYSVLVYEAEIYFREPGERVFNVTIPGDPPTSVVPLADIVQDAAGPHHPFVYEHDVLVTNHSLTLRFTGVKDNAKLCALQISLLVPDDQQAGFETFIHEIAPPKHVESRDFSVSVLSVLVFTLLAAVMAEGIGYRLTIIIGGCAAVATQVVAMYGTSIISTAIMQATFSLALAGLLILSAFVYLLVPETQFQLATSLVDAAVILSTLIATGITKLLTSHGVPVLLLLFFSLIPTVTSVVVACLLPRDPEQGLQASHASLVKCGDGDGPLVAVKDTLSTRNLRLLSVWWVFGSGVGPLLIAHASDLFTAISHPIQPESDAAAGQSYIGVLLLGDVAALAGAGVAIIAAKAAAKTGGLFYILGSLLIGGCAIGMAFSTSLLLAANLFFLASFVQHLLHCLVYAQAALLLRNSRFALLFVTNTAGRLVVQGIIQIWTAQPKAGVLAEFVGLGAYSIVVACAFAFMYWKYRSQTERTAIVALPDAEGGYSLVNEDQPPKFGTDEDWDDVWLQEGHSVHPREFADEEGGGPNPIGEVRPA